MYSKGQIVYSKCGRDKGRTFIVIDFDEEFIYLADGDLRRLEKPKKKKFKHVQIVNKVDLGIKEKLEKGYILDADLRKAIKAFNL